MNTNVKVPMDGSVVRMKGLPFAATNNEVISFFKGLTLTTENVHLKLYQDGRRTGEAYVVFPTTAQAQKALHKDRCSFGEQYGDRYVRVYEAKDADLQDMKIMLQQQRPAQVDTLVKIKGIPFEAMSADIARFLDGYRIKPHGLWRVLFDDSDRASGEAFVDFETPDDARQAVMHRNGKVFNPRLGDRYVLLRQVHRSELLNYQRSGRGKLTMRSGPIETSAAAAATAEMAGDLDTTDFFPPSGTSTTAPTSFAPSGTHGAQQRRSAAHGSVNHSAQPSTAPSITELDFDSAFPGLPGSAEPRTSVSSAAAATATPLQPRTSVVASSGATRVAFASFDDFGSQFTSSDHLLRAPQLTSSLPAPSSAPSPPSSSMPDLSAYPVPVVSSSPPQPPTAFVSDVSIAQRDSGGDDTGDDALADILDLLNVRIDNEEPQGAGAAGGNCSHLASHSGFDSLSASSYMPPRPRMANVSSPAAANGLRAHDAPHDLCCPITMSLLAEPVLASDGILYSREAIEMWLTKSSTSPMTGEPLQPGVLIPCLLARTLVHAWLQKHKRI